MTVPVCPYCFKPLWENGHGEVFDYCISCEQELNTVFRMNMDISEVQMVQPIVPDSLTEENFKNKD